MDGALLFANYVAQWNDLNYGTDNVKLILGFRNRDVIYEPIPWDAKNEIFRLPYI